MEANNSDLLTRKQVSEKFKVSYPTLKRWRDKRILPAYKIGRTIRYKELDIQNLLTAKSVSDVNL